MELLTPEGFDRLIVANLIVGVLLAGLRFYRDMTRNHADLTTSLEDTQPNHTESGRS
jgi:hypothetical protein